MRQPPQIWGSVSGVQGWLISRICEGVAFGVRSLVCSVQCLVYSVGYVVVSAECLGKHAPRPPLLLNAVRDTR